MKTLIFINLICFYNVILHLETIDLEWWINVLCKTSNSSQ